MATACNGAMLQIRGVKSRLAMLLKDIGQGANDLINIGIWA